MEGRMQDPSAKPSTTTEGMVRIPGGSHSLHRESTEPFLEALRIFLEGA